VKRDDSTLSLQPSPACRPAYPTNAKRKPLRTIAGVGGASAVLGGCAVFWPLLAPIFEHGWGGVAYGCIVVSPPVFLSEEDVADLVREELIAAGYGAVEIGPDCPAFAITRVRHKDNCMMADWEVQGGLVVTDHFDLCDRDASFSLEVVTNNDYERIVDEAGISMCSVHGYSIRALADHVALEAVAGARTRYVGIFYAPTQGEDQDSGEGAEDRALEALRAQVQDFVVWLERHPVGR
jgi:hypothetical protein